MSTLSLLPLIRVSDGVQTDEDWSLSIAFYLDDGVTPVSLDGLDFTLNIGSFATLVTGGGQIFVSGPSNNVLVVAVLAALKGSWPLGVHALSLSVSDGVYTRDIFAYSSLTVGTGQITRVSLLVAPDTIPRSVASTVPAALAEAIQALQPESIASALAGLSSAQLSTLTQAIFGSLAVQTGANAPVASGQAFINSSGYVVIAQ